MPASYGPQANPGAYVPSTNIWDVSQVYTVENIDPGLRELLVRMYQNLSNMANLLNIKDSGYYVQNEFLNSQGFFQNPSTTTNTTINPELRNVFRTVVNFGALPNAGATSVNHGISVTSTYTFTRIYGCASNPGTAFIPIPYASSVDVAHNIQLDVNATQVTITTGANYSAYTTTYVVLEYIKQ